VVNKLHTLSFLRSVTEGGPKTALFYRCNNVIVYSQPIFIIFGTHSYGVGELNSLLNFQPNARFRSLAPRGSIKPTVPLSGHK